MDDDDMYSGDYEMEGSENEELEMSENEESEMSENEESEMSENEESENEESENEELENEESEMSVNQDRLSELPSSLILHILSFLPMKDVVSTMILSKCWKNIWNTVPCLNFTGRIHDENGANIIRNFVNHTLVFWRGNKIQTFTLDFEGLVDTSLAKDIDVWVLYAKEYKVEELNIHLVDSEPDMYRAPHCLNSCSSLQKLSLVGCNLRIPESPPPWNQLNSLRIDSFLLSEHLINQILLGAPQLEDLKLRVERNENLNIRSRSLKKLSVEKHISFFSYNEKPSKETKLRIWCPNLESLELFGIWYSEYLLTDGSSIIDATLGFTRPFRFDGTELLEEALRQILSTIPRIEKVTVSDWCVQAIAPMRKRYSLSPLSSVKILKLNVRSIKLDKLVDMLLVFPKVKTLIIENEGCPSVTDYYEGQHVIVPHELDAEHAVRNLPKSFMLQLSHVEITSSLCETSVFPFVELLLKHASGLQKMVIWARGIMSFPLESFFLASEKLLSMPRSSPTAKVIFCKK